MLSEEERVFKLFRPRLLRASRSFMGAQSSEAEDMVHDTFLVAFHSLTRADPQVPIYALLHQICLRLCYARLRSSAGVLRCLEADLRLTMQRLGVERVASTNLEVQKQQELEVLRELIKQLHPDSRQIIQLRNVNGMTYAQIKATLGVPHDVVLARLGSARRQMRDLVTGLPKLSPSSKHPQTV